MDEAVCLQINTRGSPYKGVFMGTQVAGSCHIDMWWWWGTRDIKWAWHAGVNWAGLEGIKCQL